LDQNPLGVGVTNKLIEAVLRCDIEAMKREIASGANPNEIDAGMTPLLWAIMGGYFDAVKLLLENGADPNVRPNPSGSPLWSAEDDFGMVAIAGLLRSYGAKK
jgi:ankyrin repeat protein